MSDSYVGFLEEMKRQKVAASSFVSEPENDLSGFCEQPSQMDSSIDSTYSAFANNLGGAGASSPIIQQHEGRALRLELSLSDDDQHWEEYDQLQKEALNSEKWASVGECKRTKKGNSTILAEGKRAIRKRNPRLDVYSEDEKCQEDEERSDWCLGQLMEGAEDVTMVNGQHLEKSVEAESEGRRGSRSRKNSQQTEQMLNQLEMEKDEEEVDKLQVIYEECSSCQKISIYYFHYSYHFKLYQLIQGGIKPHICGACSMPLIQKINVVIPATSVTRNSRSSESLQKADIPNQRLIGKDLGQNRAKLADKKEFPCSGCSKLFSSKQHAKNHPYTHMSKEELDKLGVFYEECHTCCKIFFNKSNFKQHQLIHSGIKSHICGVCSMAFTLKQNLVTHANVHLNPKEKQKIKSGWKNVCYFCDQKFKTPSHLIEHFPIHSKERPFRCNVCQQTFIRQSHLTSHKKFVHEKRRQFICQDCGKSFGTKRDLERHSVVHSGTLPFQCPQCDKSFTDKSNLNAHLKSVHFGVKYKCCKCSKSFSASSSLKRHLKNVHK